MATQITATDLVKRLSDILNRVRYRSESFIIERNGERIADLVPSAPLRTVTLRELAANLGDLALPGEGFADDLEAVQASQPSTEAPAWRS